MVPVPDIWAQALEAGKTMAKLASRFSDGKRLKPERA